MGARTSRPTTVAADDLRDRVAGDPPGGLGAGADGSSWLAAGVHRAVDALALELLLGGALQR